MSPNVPRMKKMKKLMTLNATSLCISISSQVIGVTEDEEDAETLEVALVEV